MYHHFSVEVRLQITNTVGRKDELATDAEEAFRVELFLEELRQGYRFARIDSMDVADIPTVNALKETQFCIRH